MARPPQVGRDYAAELKGKVVLDTGNPYPGRDGDMAVRDRQRGTGVASAEYLPGTRLVRAFNAINAGPLANQAFASRKAGYSAGIGRPGGHENRRPAGLGRRIRPGAGGRARPGPGIRLRNPGLRRGMTAAELRKALNLKEAKRTLRPFIGKKWWPASQKPGGCLPSVIAR